MKNIIFITLLAFGMGAKAQITFEFDHDSASSIGTNANDFVINQLMIVRFEGSGERYVKINKNGKIICIYDLNHVLLKTISIANIVGNDNINAVSFLYFSEHLFNIDSKIEFMYISNANDPYTTGIYNEDGNLLFSDTGAAMIKMNVPLQQYPIYNTLQGTKMILSYGNGHAKVFSLPGTLSTSIAEANGQLMQTQNGAFGNLYPNPSNGTVTLQYQLPEGEQSGELVLYNLQGTEVKRYKVDNTFKDLLLDNSQLPAGTYFYQLQTGKGEVGIKKMIVMK